ncbi:DUF3237 family protein [Nocardia rhamnosiphila]|uniref:DUF3237 family protein n=1 Tax=Nocardia rhamnosiphila TaxID=426716 RepID=A0ABV2X2A2_9NOCA
MAHGQHADSRRAPLQHSNRNLGDAVGEIPGGTRIVVTVTGGQFHGPDPRGPVTAGADWAVRRPGGPLTLDVSEPNCEPRTMWSS